MLPEKDFDTWNEEQKRINSISVRPHYAEGQIWWCSLGTNIGSEQDGTGTSQQRPVIILKYLNKSTCYIAPLTTSTKQDKYRITAGKIVGKENVVNISQIRQIDVKRLSRLIGYMKRSVFWNIRENARKLF